MIEQPVGEFHTHKNEFGHIVKCYHKSKDVIMSFSFWIGVTFSFPIEHFLWEKVWPFTVVSKLMGL